MIDSWMVRQIQPTLNQFALDWVPKWLRANAVTVIGFLVGLLVLPLLRDQAYLLALVVILFNRFLDGLDGAIARRDGISDFGGFLDICCDFIFYSAVVFGFALADPQQNALAASFLIFSYVGTGTSFLAYAIMASKREMQSDSHGTKAFIYLGGLTEGTETILFMFLICLFPGWFPEMATGFGILCWLTTFGRIATAVQSFKN